MFDVAVIEDPAAAEVLLDPIRALLLAELRVPASAATVAARFGLPRQKVNYHLSALEKHGLVSLVEERRKGNVTERIMGAVAISFGISPAALPGVHYGAGGQHRPPCGKIPQPKRRRRAQPSPRRRASPKCQD